MVYFSITACHLQNYLKIVHLDNHTTSIVYGYQSLIKNLVLKIISKFISWFFSDFPSTEAASLHSIRFGVLFSFEKPNTS